MVIKHVPHGYGRVASFIFTGHRKVLHESYLVVSKFYLYARSRWFSQLKSMGYHPGDVSGLEMDVADILYDYGLTRFSKKGMHQKHLSLANS